MRARLVNSLRATSQRRWIGAKEEGRIDSKRLYRAVLGIDNFVFKQRTNKIALNTVVALAIDHSGSMAGDKLKLAGQSALLIGDVLNSLKIPFMVYGYSTEECYRSIPDKSIYARWNSLIITSYRTFSESWETGARRLATASRNVQNNTLDGESVKFGAQQLLRCPEKRKILIVFNDGMPYPGSGYVGRGQHYLKNVVQSVSDAGVEVIGFGIQDASVRTYYPNNVVIRDLRELVKQPLQTLDSLLRKGVKL
ncbi:VWA domain-containing protein [bacterium]|nr:VWA domain-containing protein [bacterium]